MKKFHSKHLSRTLLSKRQATLARGCPYSRTLVRFHKISYNSTRNWLNVEPEPYQATILSPVCSAWSLIEREGVSYIGFRVLGKACWCSAILTSRSKLYYFLKWIFKWNMCIMELDDWRSIFQNVASLNVFVYEMITGLSMSIELTHKNKLMQNLCNKIILDSLIHKFEKTFME